MAPAPPRQPRARRPSAAPASVFRELLRAVPSAARQQRGRRLRRSGRTQEQRVWTHPPRRRHPRPPRAQPLPAAMEHPTSRRDPLATESFAYRRAPHPGHLPLRALQRFQEAPRPVPGVRPRGLVEVALRARKPRARSHPNPHARRRRQQGVAARRQHQHGSMSPSARSDRRVSRPAERKAPQPVWKPNWPLSPPPEGQPPPASLPSRRPDHWPFQPRPLPKTWPGPQHRPRLRRYRVRPEKERQRDPAARPDPGFDPRAIGGLPHPRPPRQHRSQRWKPQTLRPIHGHLPPILAPPGGASANRKRAFRERKSPRPGLRRRSRRTTPRIPL